MMIKLSVIPEPVSFKIKSSKPVFALGDDVIFEGNEESENSLSDLTEFLLRIFGYIPTGYGKGKIRLEILPAEPSEGYSIKIENDRVVLTGNSKSGLFYAVQTLKQLLFQSEGILPELEITDFPRFPSRGFMLDCGRYFFTVDAVKQFIDMAALHKLNEFHWHLTEDQGFRCQLENKLLLTEIGSYRSHTCFGSKPHEGYYTKAELKEIIDYAHRKHMKVIPEIDSPGHVMSMLAAYPHLACAERDYTVSTFFGVKHDVLCIGKESTFEFMKELFDELTEIFTDGIIHIGGDEVPTVRWKSCPECQRRMKEEGFTKEKELHTYYLDRIAAHLESKGVEVRMWNDSIKDKTVKRNICWQLWNSEISEKDVVRELNAGRKFILSPSAYCYLDLPYALTSLEKCYNYNPVPDGLTDEGRKNLLGVEACLWTELIPDMEKADRMTYPRLAAICEAAWSPDEKRSYNRFCEKLYGFCALLYEEGISPCNIKSAVPGRLKKVLGILYWERRKLLWGAHHNIISDIKAKRYFKNRK